MEVLAGRWGNDGLYHQMPCLYITQCSDNGLMLPRTDAHVNRLCLQGWVTNTANICITPVEYGLWQMLYPTSNSPKPNHLYWTRGWRVLKFFYYKNHERKTIHLTTYTPNEPWKGSYVDKRILGSTLENGGWIYTEYPMDRPLWVQPLFLWAIDTRCRSPHPISASRI